MMSRSVVVVCVLGLVCGAANAALMWSSDLLASRNGNFQTPGPDVSWGENNTAGVSGLAGDYVGDVAKTVFPNWQFAVGNTSRTNGNGVSQYSDATRGYVAKFAYHGVYRSIGGYISSDPIEGTTVEASRYKLDIWTRTDASGGIRGFNAGFLFGNITGWADVTNFFETNNGKWGAPYEVNMQTNTRREGNWTTWEHTVVYWDNTGTKTETFGLAGTINAVGTLEGYASETVDGVVNIRYYTNQRGLGQALRVGASFVTSTNGGAGNIYFDGFQVSKEIPEPATMAVLGIGGLAMLLKRRRRS